MEPGGGGVFRFGLLGPLEVARNGAFLEPRGLRQRALLALLLLRANEVVPRERLVDGLWGEDPPETAANSLQVAVHELRKMLGAERVETQGRGYRLRVEDGELDLHRFERLVEEARASNDPAPLLQEALGLWRGPALADLREAPFAAVEAERLDELRLAAAESRIAAELDLGGGLELVPELRALVGEHPYRERLHEQLMLALYRGGRQAEALEAYREARRLLAEELGLDPGPALQELERRILRGDPDLAGITLPPTNLPAPANPLVGRELELAAVTALFSREDVRLLTLTGPGGTGKTRLALAVAQELAADFPDGVWFVGLAAVRDAELVASTIAQTLDVGETARGSLLDALGQHLRERRALLILDNFEQVGAAAPLVAELLAAAPRTKALVTSRAVLRLSGEHDYPVPPLPLPDPDGDPDALAHNGAVTLFVARAQAVRPGFRLEGHARAVAEICRAVDGLPLALELAAARVKVLAPEALLDRLERRLPLLDRGAADLPGRQQTLRAAIDWSYELLDEDERALFARLAVFVGGCTVDAAEAVCGADLDALTSLVDKSLLRERAEDRFGMLETLREYAGERLEESGEAEVLRKRHAEHFLARAIASASELTGAETAMWMRRLESEHDNLRAALAWAGAGGHVELELRLAAALQRFWRTRGHVTEARRTLESALARGQSASPSVRAKALTAAADFADRQGERGVARAHLEQALELFREAGDAREEARALSELGGVAALEGDYARATALFEQTMPLFRATDDTRAYMVTVSNLASVASLSGDHERAQALNEEALELARGADDRDQMTISLHNLGRALVGQGRFGEAAGFLAESLEISLELGYRELLANCLQAFAELSAARGEPERAARLLGAAESVLGELGVALGTEERQGYERALRALESELGDEALRSLRAEGAALPLAEAAALALR